MTQIPTAEELLLEEIKKFTSPLTNVGLQLLVINVANEHAKNHVQAALKAAAENAEITNKARFPGDYNPVVDEDSILNAYPLENIK